MLECKLGIRIFKNSSGDMNVQPNLETTELHAYLMKKAGLGEARYVLYNVHILLKEVGTLGLCTHRRTRLWMEKKF